MKYKKQMTKEEFDEYLDNVKIKMGELGFGVLTDRKQNNINVMVHGVGLFSVEIIPERKPLPVDTLVIDEDGRKFFTTGAHNTDHGVMDLFANGASSKTAKASDNYAK